MLTYFSQTALSIQFQLKWGSLPGSGKGKFSILPRKNHCHDLTKQDIHFHKPLGLLHPLPQLRLLAVLKWPLAKLVSPRAPELDFVG